MASSSTLPTWKQPPSWFRHPSQAEAIALQASSRRVDLGGLLREIARCLENAQLAGKPLVHGATRFIDQWRVGPWQHRPLLEGLLIRGRRGVVAPERDTAAHLGA